jgi:phosphopantothenoylcysteine decarboxylase/phosphopantothenate--cysteine ligase
MGYAIARAAFRRGAEVTLVHGPTNLQNPAGVECVPVTTASQMYDEVMARYTEMTLIIKAAAVADFKPVEFHNEKVKKDSATLTMQLEPNEDILHTLGDVRDPARQTLVGFAAESTNVEAEGRKKLVKKKLDLIAVNDITTAQGGFEVDTNQLVLIDKQNLEILPHTTKIKTADLLLDYIIAHSLLKP